MSNNPFRRIKEQVNIVDVAKRLGLEVHERGSHVEAWPCPHGHDSKSKTCFHLLPQYNGYKCHNCGESGDVSHVVSLLRTGCRKNLNLAISWLCEEFRLDALWQGWTQEEKDTYNDTN